MNRRQILKTLSLGALAAPLAVSACRKPDESDPVWTYSEDKGIYEEGMMTPTLIQNGCAYDTVMQYRRIGNVVYVTGTFQVTP